MYLDSNLGPAADHTDQLQDIISDIRSAIFGLHIDGVDSNAVPRAEASRLTITVSAGVDLVIDVVDDGLGIPVVDARNGLHDLAQRAIAFGGSFRVQKQLLDDLPGPLADPGTFGGGLLLGPERS